MSADDWICGMNRDPIVTPLSVMPLYCYHCLYFLNELEYWDQTALSLVISQSRYHNIIAEHVSQF